MVEANQVPALRIPVGEGRDFRGARESDEIFLLQTLVTHWKVSIRKNKR
jgi:hypothetical protein